MRGNRLAVVKGKHKHHYLFRHHSLHACYTLSPQPYILPSRPFMSPRKSHVSWRVLVNVAMPILRAGGPFFRALQSHGKLSFHDRASQPSFRLQFHHSWDCTAPKRNREANVNWPVELSYPTCVTCTGFSGTEMTGFLGDPTSVLMRPEKPDFFLKTPGLGPLVVNWDR